MNVLVVGSLAYDSVMYCPGRLSDSISNETTQRISLNISAHKLERYYGGTAGSIAYTLKLLGIQPFIVAGVGNDCSDYKQFLKKNKIPTTYIQEHRTERTSEYVCVRDKYQNTIGIFYEGAGKEMSFSIFESIREHIHFAIIAPTYPHIMTQAIKVCIKRAIPYLYDPGFQTSLLTQEELQEGIKTASILVGTLTTITNIKEKLERSHEELVMNVPALITTLGDKGSIIETRKENIHIKPVRNIAVIDPNGAGYAYKSGFVCGYLHQYPLDVCGQIGSVAASFAVESHGTQTHTFTKHEFTKRYEKQYHARVKI